MRIAVAKMAGSLGVAAVALGAGTAALGGSMDLEWTPAGGSDITGYRIYAGSRPDALNHAADVPNVASSTLGNLTSCAYYYVAVKARDSRGVLSEQYSNVVEGYPHPDVASVSPTVLGRGLGASLVVTGAGFVTGAVPSFQSPTIAISSKGVLIHGNSFSRLSLSIRLLVQLMPELARDVLKLGQGLQIDLSRARERHVGDRADSPGARRQ